MSAQRWSEQQGPECSLLVRVCRLLKAISLPVLIGALLLGGTLVVVFYKALDATNHEAFCISCHEMKINYEEYKDSMHYRNPSGVRATCPDCHVPREFGPKMAAKLRAAKDVWHHLLGTLDTREKYEAQRLRMAKMVWQEMQETDSRECRTCHRIESMDFDEQGKRAARKHQRMAEKGKTCIDCHRGVAHELPDTIDEVETEEDA
jgi:cytochrome c-type protein NapC